MVTTFDFERRAQLHAKVFSFVVDADHQRELGFREPHHAGASDCVLRRPFARVAFLALLRLARGLQPGRGAHPRAGRMGPRARAATSAD